MGFQRAVGAVLILAMAGCGDETLPRCDPGQTAECACPGGVKGAQTCAPDGMAWEDCRCPDATSPDSGPFGPELSVQRVDCPMAGPLVVQAFFPGKLAQQLALVRGLGHWAPAAPPHPTPYVTIERLEIDDELARAECQNFDYVFFVFPVAPY